jgi:hypothetical protein
MASKRNIRRRQCAGKLGYTSLTDAIHASQFGQRRYGWQRLNAYHCAWCHTYHLGHPPRGVRQAIAERNGKYV